MKFIKADKPISTKHEKLGEISVEVEVPQVENYDEFVQLAGSADNALAWLNNNLETAAKNGGRAALRNLADDANLEEAVPRIQALVKEYKPQQGTSQTTIVRKKAATLDSIAALVESGEELTKEKLLEMLAAAK